MSVDLTTLAAVREHMQISDADDDAQDDLIEELIPAVSEAVRDWCEREFVDAAAGGERTFYYDGKGWLDLAPYDARSIVTVTVDGQELGEAAFDVWPLPARHGVVTHLVLPQRATRCKVVVDADWGFAEVPAAVERATIIAVHYAMRTTSSFMGSEFDVDAGFQGASKLLPGASLRLLAPYRRHSVGA
jgi:hypothetical protein